MSHEIVDEAPSQARLATAVARLSEFTTLAQSALRSRDWSAASPTTTEAVRRLRGTANAVQTALDTLLARQTVRLATNSSNIAAFPHDVLLHIFQVWLSLDVRSNNHRSRPIPCEFTAASVNRHWRAVAVQSPRLWTDLLVDYELWPNIDDYVDIILSRSSARPIRLTIRKAPVNWVPCQLSQDKLARVLSVTSTVDCQFASAPPSLISFASTLLPIFQAPMPLLEEVMFSGLRQQCTMPPHIQLFTMSPKLRRIDLGQLPFTLLDCTGLANLESFSISRAVAGDEMAILCRSCPRLSSLSVPDISHPWTVGVQAFPALTILHCDTHNVVAWLASPQNAPRLHTLEIAGDDITGEAISLFLDNSPWTTLRTLELHSLWDASTDDALSAFLPVMRNLPNLVELRISEGLYLAAFFDDWRSEDWIEGAPSVEHLVLRQCSFPADALRALVSFFVSRQARIGRSITNLTITQNGVLPYETELFPMWMSARLEQLVGSVIIDTVTAEVDGPPI